MNGEFLAMPFVTGKQQDTAYSHSELHTTYTKYLKIARVNIDSIIKYKDDLFEPRYIE